MPYVDILFGNEVEAAAFAKKKGWERSALANAHAVPHVCQRILAPALASSSLPKARMLRVLL